MATPAQLLSTKGGEKMPKIKKNSEDKDVQDVGGPEKDWSTADYAKFKFDATSGVKPDTTILPNARVKAQPMVKIKEEEEPDAELTDPEADVEGDEEEAPKKSHHKKGGDDPAPESDSEVEPDVEGEEEPTEEAKDAEEGEKEEEDENIVWGDAVEDGKQGDDLDLELDDLKDGDTELKDLTQTEGDEEGEEDVHIDINSHDDQKGDLTDEVDQDLIDGDEEPKIADDEDEVSVEDEEMLPGQKMPKLAFSDEPTDAVIESDDNDEDDEAKDDEEAEEDDELKEGKKKKFELFKKKSKDAKGKKVEESKIRISFKVDESKKLFEGNTVLTEEDVRQSRVLFEGAVRVAAKTIGKQLHEAYQARFDEVRKLNEAKVAKQMDRYLSYVVEQWVKENRVALRAQLRNKLTENLLAGLKNLFLEHWIEVPKSKVNVVEALAKNVKTLKARLRESETQAVALHQEQKAVIARERKALVREHRARLIAEAASAVIAVDRGKFGLRAESLKFTDTKTFKKDLIALREQYFTAKKTGERPSDVPNATPLFEEKLRRQGTTAVGVYSDTLDKLSGQ